MPSRWTKRVYHNRGRNDWWDPAVQGSAWQHDVLHESQFSDDLLIESGSNGLDWSHSLLPHDAGGDLWIVRRFYDETSTGTMTFHGDPAGSQTSPMQQTPLVAKQTDISNGFFPFGGNPPSPPWSEMDVKGTEGISKTIPTSPVINIAASLGELVSDGFPSAHLVADTGKARALRSVNAGGSYLNAEFGWKPLVRDVQSFARAVLDREKILDEYHKNSGKMLRRKYRWEPELDEGEWDEGSWHPQPGLYSGLYRPDGTFHITAKAVGKIEWWFSATYQYYVPPREDKNERWTSDAHHLLGSKLTPEALWNLAPWSWAADWIANTGDIMKNISAMTTDGLVIHHAHIMRKHTVTYTYTNEIMNGFWSYPGPMRLEQKLTTVIKSRRAATPFGFGLSWDGFTPSQWAVLGALGISRY